MIEFDDDDDDDEEEEEDSPSTSMRIIGRVGDAALIFETNGEIVKARTGLESAICFAISLVVLRGLVVVMMAPRDMTERHTTGK